MAETTSKPWEIQHLASSHDRASFDCGKPALNDWLRLRAGQHERRDVCRTYVVVQRSESDVLAYAVSSHMVSYEALLEEQARGLPAIDVPAALLGRLAVDSTAQRQGFGRRLLLDALRRLQQLSDHIGIRAVEVHAIDEEARSFYLAYGFVSLRDDRRHLYLPMHLIRKLDLPPLSLRGLLLVAQPPTAVPLPILLPIAIDEAAKIRGGLFQSPRVHAELSRNKVWRGPRMAASNRHFPLCSAKW